VNLSDLLLIVALIAFVLAAISFGFKKTDLLGVGLAAWALSELINRLSNLSLGTILLALAFIAFVLAAIGWKYKKIGTIGPGIAMWIASLLPPLVNK